jgi:hypothetical protein
VLEISGLDFGQDSPVSDVLEVVGDEVDHGAAELTELFLGRHPDQFLIFPPKLTDANILDFPAKIDRRKRFKFSAQNRLMQFFLDFHAKIDGCKFLDFPAKIDGCKFFGFSRQN